MNWLYRLLVEHLDKMVLDCEGDLVYIQDDLPEGEDYKKVKRILTLEEYKDLYCRWIRYQLERISHYG